MVAAAVGVVMVAIWLASKRLEFTWRVSWLLVALVVVCVSGATAGSALASGIAGGIWTAAHGFAVFLGDL